MTKNMTLLMKCVLLIFLPLVIARNVKLSREIDRDVEHDFHGDYINVPEQEQNDWRALANMRLEENLEAIGKIAQLHKKAKNVILFVGDGMGISTLTASRIFLGQTRGLTGDDARLSWETFPNVALSKTYAANLQVPDSASTATALVCGEKTNGLTLGVNQRAEFMNCTSEAGNELTSILHHAIDEGKWTGVISTARLTHATPAASYAHTVFRGWESDGDLPADAIGVCADIASQFIDNERNHDIRVFLGGGREQFMPNTQTDPEYPDETGGRTDGRDLIQEWQDQKAAMGLDSSEYAYVYNQAGFDAVDPAQVDYLFGAFEHSHMQWEADRASDGDGEPSLAEMTEKAIDILKRGREGYFLFVEGGRIDHGHHYNQPMRAMMDTVALSDAVQKAIDLTCEDETLIVVTADHSHVFTIAGFPQLNTDILGFDEGSLFQMGLDGKPYTTLGYTNGPGYFSHRTDENGDLQERPDPTDILDELKSGTMLWDAGIPTQVETHAGEDVAVFARGPMAHLFMGTQEQSYYGNAMMYALCVGEQKELCERNNRPGRPGNDNNRGMDN